MKKSTRVLMGVVLLCLLAVAGIFAYNKSHEANKKLASTTNTQSQTNVVEPAGTDVTSAQTAKPTNEFDIPELGVKMMLPNGIEDLQYTVQKDRYDDHMFASFSTKSIQDADGQNTWCTADHGTLGSLHRWNSDKDINDEALRAKRIGLYKYTFASVQSSCSDKKEVLDMQLTQGKLMEEAYKTMSQPGQ